jgi:hypothetical protein
MALAISIGWSSEVKNVQRVVHTSFPTQTFDDQGHASRVFFSGKEISLAKIKYGTCSPLGVHIDFNSLILESTLIGVNPRMQGTKEEGEYIGSIDFSALNSAAVENIREAAYCINAWDHNYQHFIIETLPKIHLAYLKTACPIIVMDQEFIREIVSIAYPDREFIFLKKNSAIKVETVYLPMPVAQNFEPVVPLQISALRHLRVKLSLPVPQTADKVYLARINVKGMAGQYRRITNDTEVLDFFRKQGVGVDDFFGKTLPEKVQLASQYRVHFTPIGANLINYLFLKNPIELNVFSHPYFVSHGFFVNLYKALDLPITYNIVPCGIEAHGEDNWKSINSPYLVDLYVLRQAFSK